MGIFQDMVEVVVRVPRKLNLRFDGQDMTLEPNYTESGELIADVHNTIPRQCIAYVLNQNVQMGTEDPFDPSRFQSMVGIVEPKVGKKNRKSWHETSFIKEDAPGIENMTRVNIREQLEDDPQVKDIVIRGRKTDGTVRLPSIDNGGTLSPRGRG